MILFRECCHIIRTILIFAITGASILEESEMEVTKLERDNISSCNISHDQIFIKRVG